MPIRLDAALKECDAQVSAERFREEIVGLFSELHGTKSDEDLIVSPMEAHAFCAVVRYKLKADRVPDDLILRTLINTRKASLR